MDILEAITFLDKQVTDPSAGLPEALFLFASRITPMVNVDLLLQDDRGRTLLSWRNDRYAGTGWHLPGGIVRFQETMKTRLDKVVASEIGTPVMFDAKPLKISEMIASHKKSRGHFISFLFKGYLSGDFIPPNKGLRRTEAGYLQWHESCPGDLLEVQKIYKRYF